MEKLQDTQTQQPGRGAPPSRDRDLPYRAHGGGPKGPLPGRRVGPERPSWGFVPEAPEMG